MHANHFQLCYQNNFFLGRLSLRTQFDYNRTRNGSTIVDRSLKMS